MLIIGSKKWHVVNSFPILRENHLVSICQLVSLGIESSEVKKKQLLSEGCKTANYAAFLYYKTSCKVYKCKCSCKRQVFQFLYLETFWGLCLTAVVWTKTLLSMMTWIFFNWFSIIKLDNKALKLICRRKNSITSALAE